MTPLSQAAIAAPTDSQDKWPSGPRATTSLRERRTPLAPPDAQRALLDRLALEGNSGLPRADFAQDLAVHGEPQLGPAGLEIFQINLGKLCNMTCRHCHVDAGPDRTDAIMSKETVEACLSALDRTTAHTVDITGGAPELNPHFRYLVEEAARRGKHVIDRCNLTILLVPKLADLPQWLAERGVEVVCSLPHYRPRNTDAQRGRGTYDRSVEALRRLNRAGYGRGDPTKRLTLMSNPAGAFLSPDQDSLEGEWKARLARDVGVSFDRLICLNNMPIARYLEWLLESGNLQGYMERLIRAFNPKTICGLMCRNTLSVSWDGYCYHCDFNQMLAMDIQPVGGERLHVRDFDPATYEAAPIRTGRHCYGCTAGAGSSCGGAVCATDTAES